MAAGAPAAVAGAPASSRARAVAAAAVVVAAGVLLPACASPSDAVGAYGAAAPSGAGSTVASSADAAHDGRLQVIASFYPLQYVAEQVGGDDVVVSSLTPPGADGHDIELTPSQVASVGEVDLVVHVSGGLQPATDEALEVVPPRELVDAAEVVDLVPTGRDGDGTAPGASADPHFWLDPLLLADVADGVADGLTAVDPSRADLWDDRAADLRARLVDLDADLTAGLAPCAGEALVVSHEAFGYLADRHGIEQVGLTGIDPEVPPSPARLRRAVAVVEGRDVRTVFFERSAGPRVTEALAEDLDLATGVLDPLEQQPAAGEDYESVMRTNLRSMVDGLGCGAAG